MQKLEKERMGQLRARPAGAPRRARRNFLVNSALTTGGNRLTPAHPAPPRLAHTARTTRTKRKRNRNPISRLASPPNLQYSNKCISYMYIICISYVYIYIYIYMYIYIYIQTENQPNSIAHTNTSTNTKT